MPPIIQMCISRVRLHNNDCIKTERFLLCIFEKFCVQCCQNKPRSHEVKVKWSDIRPSMVTHTRNLCSAFIPSKVHTHSSEHTHTVNTHPEQWAAIYAAAPGEQLGVGCLAQGHLSRGIEGGESAVHSLPPPTIPAGPETRTRNPLTIRPRLPLDHMDPQKQLKMLHYASVVGDVTL